MIKCLVSMVELVSMIYLINLLSLNYLPFNKKIRKDINRWELLPFFNFESKVESCVENVVVVFCQN